MKRKAARKAPRKPTRALAVRRDTPLDLPAPHVTAPRPLGPPQVSSALGVRRLETIEAGYEVWQELREHHRAALARLADEQRKLEQQGEFVVGAVRAARDDVGEKGSELDTYVDGMSKKLEQARAELDAAAQASSAKWAESFAAVRTELRGRIDRALAAVRPKLRLRLRALPDDKRILHVDRPSADEAVMLCVLFTGKLPSRYEYLFDDSNDDLREAPPTLYAEEGVLAAHVRPDAQAVGALVSGPYAVLALKGMLPFALPMPGGATLLVRLLERGPVMEAEVADGHTFRNVLAKDEAERIAGHLLKLKLEGRIELELGAE